MGDGIRTPKYKACDRCGRNDHKVALRVDAKMAGRVIGRKCIGRCPSCFADAFVTKHWLGEGHVPFEGATVVYDRRGDRAKKATPVPERMVQQ
jgi:hypothetical protein